MGICPGNRQNKELLMSFLILLNLPITYVLFKFFNNPELALVVRVCINFITAIARIIYLNYLYGFPIYAYLKEVVFICFMVMLISFPIPYFIHQNMQISLVNTLLSLILSLVCAIIVTTIIGLRQKERTLIINKIRYILHLS